MAKDKIREWVITDVEDEQGPGLVLEKPGRAPLVMAYEPGMERDVLIEYATTRVLEAEIRDAGGVMFDVGADGQVIGDTGRAPTALLDDYRHHVEDSRFNQGARERLRRRAEQEAN